MEGIQRELLSASGAQEMSERKDQAVACSRGKGVLAIRDLGVDPQQY
jgi:hypothetical protein